MGTYAEQNFVEWEMQKKVCVRERERNRFWSTDMWNKFSPNSHYTNTCTRIHTKQLNERKKMMHVKLFIFHNVVFVFVVAIDAVVAAIVSCCRRRRCRFSFIRFLFRWESCFRTTTQIIYLYHISVHFHWKFLYATHISFGFDLLLPFIWLTIRLIVHLSCIGIAIAMACTYQSIKLKCAHLWQSSSWRGRKNQTNLYIGVACSCCLMMWEHPQKVGRQNENRMARGMRLVRDMEKFSWLIVDIEQHITITRITWENHQTRLVKWSGGKIANNAVYKWFTISHRSLIFRHFLWIEEWFAIRSAFSPKNCLGSTVHT